MCVCVYHVVNFPQGADSVAHTCGKGGRETGAAEGPGRFSAHLRIGYAHAAQHVQERSGEQNLLL